jgi:L-asparaginase
MKKSKILVLTTGGTIEKSYSEDDGSIANRESIFRDKLLRRLRLPHTDVQVEQIMAKDSLDMDDADRRRIAGRIEGAFAQCDGIVVLHGTDTVDHTLAACSALIAHVDKPVVFTGAMRPAGFDDSDAQQNFTEALLAAQILAPGLYLSFHGHLFSGPTFKKDKIQKTFVHFEAKP